MTRRNSCAVVAGVLFMAGLAQAADFLHPRMKSGEAEIGTVVMLPAIAEMTKRGVKGMEGMGGEAEEANRLLSAAVSAALANRGFTVENPFTEETLNQDHELKYAVADVQKRFDQVSAQLFKKNKDVRKGRFSIGDSVAVLNFNGAADAFIVIRAEGIKDTKGKALMKGGPIALAKSGKAEFKSRVAMVDARNGDVLFLGDYESKGLPRDGTYEKSFRRIRVSTRPRTQPPPMQVAGQAAGQVEREAVNPPNPEPVTITLGHSIDDVERALGKPKNIIDLGAKKLYIYQNLKVTFTAGKVSDVE